MGGDVPVMDEDSTLMDEQAPLLGSPSAGGNSAAPLSSARTSGSLFYFDILHITVYLCVSMYQST
jgi:hypothetical protein